MLLCQIKSCDRNSSRWQPDKRLRALFTRFTRKFTSRTPFRITLIFQTLWPVNRTGRALSYKAKKKERAALVHTIGRDDWTSSYYWSPLPQYSNWLSDSWLEFLVTVQRTLALSKFTKNRHNSNLFSSFRTPIWCAYEQNTESQTPKVFLEEFKQTFKTSDTSMSSISWIKILVQKFCRIVQTFSSALLVRCSNPFWAFTELGIL